MWGLNLNDAANIAQLSIRQSRNRCRGVGMRCEKTATFHNMLIPEWLSHYYELSVGPFRSLTKLPDAEAAKIPKALIQNVEVFAGKHQINYLEIRRELEATVRQKFIEKGGKPELQQPHYMILGSCSWLLEWYKEGREIRVHLRNFDVDVVSFTYGDTFPAMRYQDGKEYRRQVYRFEELPALIERFGLPQEWNADGQHGPERYIEAQVWSDKPVAGYLQNVHGETSP